MAGQSEQAWLIVAAITAGCVVINVIAIATAKETYRTPLSELGDADAADARREAVHAG
ncbi:hypothetical protein [Microbacterium sp. SORGH_AS_0862]|uniref:hypothetical protein n=1 Tax=Microbacterium sp. SORGH_AS_0862 TaxID=3041789 RepID=UPI00278E6150|nr:hypothetical protein [Microbacterium sp. SORGH_AS_0862]MDQ1206988.1 hypothetical protein [Microbacterium sp. SORGH_AS_0862]